MSTPKPSSSKPPPAKASRGFLVKHPQAVVSAATEPPSVKSPVPKTKGRKSLTVKLPPLTSKQRPPLGDREFQAERKEQRNEKARLRMARCASSACVVPPLRLTISIGSVPSLKLDPSKNNWRPPSRPEHTSGPIAKNLARWEAQRRIELYKARFGHAVYAAYLKQRRHARIRRRAKEEERRAKKERTVSVVENRAARSRPRVLTADAHSSD
ncbi:hypothetical protein DFH07DRAFT_955777 [Mycena maculata]|uniref:Uncharacterized protein n=1 Tax=Mycena maculata TaxID=230809 RepID=A0AAD7NL19_9AGAR|nr:hypothetical protein DFH07DRAFT_955777 [Mycena maculata]